MFFKLSLLALIALVGSVSCQVVNGVNSYIEKYPFMVSVRDNMGNPFCGGTIVNAVLILTAAHCVSDQSPSDLSIQYGTTVISADSQNVINVKDIIVHKNFNLKRKDYDIALLVLENPMVYDYKTVRAVVLPKLLYEVPQDKNGVPGILLGWGAKTDTGKMESNLQEVELKIYSDEECKSLKKIFTSKLLCGGVDKGVKGICYGDSGGPLLSKDFVQLGIVSSFTKPCGSSPGSFTKVSQFRDWISDNLE